MEWNEEEEEEEEEEKKKKREGHKVQYLTTEEEYISQFSRQ